MDDFPVRDEFLGSGYGNFTEEGIQALHLLGEMEGIQLDGTYTGKAMAALLQDAASGLLRDKSVLFWNTLNAQDFSEKISDVDYRMLPQKVHRFFESEVQDPSGRL
jgi:D-cysteine desulfhydrase